MTEFLIDINLRDAHSEEFMRLIPKQRTIVNDLMFEGKIVSYCVSLDRAKVWIMMIARNEDDVMDMLSRFPLIDYMDCEIHELLFHNTAQQTFSQISLN